MKNTGTLATRYITVAELARRESTAERLVSQKHIYDCKKNGTMKCFVVIGGKIFVDLNKFKAIPYKKRGPKRKKKK